MEQPEFTTLTPEAFEQEVRFYLQTLGASLKSSEVRHRETLSAHDGAYEIDVTARFSALGGDFLVLIECKHHGRRIGREDVQVLHDRMLSLGAQKGMLFSASRFQRGAIEFAQAHRIALVQMVDGKTTYFTKGLGSRPDPPPWANIGRYAGWLVSLTENGGEHQSLVSRDCLKYLREFLVERSPGS